MNRIFAILLVFTLLFGAVSCSSDDSNSEEKNSSFVSYEIKAENAAIKKHIKKTLEACSYRGVVCLTRNGEELYCAGMGKDAGGCPIKADSSIYIGSVSKQFCSASVMMLRDEGKLSVDDTIDKFFPEYEFGKNITVKNLLTMRSGLPDMVNDAVNSGVSDANTEKENVAALNKWIFEQELIFEPDTQYYYSNSNYFLLAEIVEQISGESYHDFVREKIFVPLGMTHSGFVDEVNDNPSWAKTIVHDDNVPETKAKGITKGAGDIVSNGADMTKWLNALMNGKVVSKKTLKEMTADYSPENAEHYGCGLEKMVKGYGHQGVIASYCASDYFNSKKGFCLFASGYSDNASYMPSTLLEDFV